MLLSLLALGFQATAATASPAGQAPIGQAPVAQAPVAPAITVTGRRLQDYAADVDACIATPCTPKKDIVVSIRYAEALFRNGDYIGARGVLSKAVHRDDRFGAQEPVALSQLYVAQANVAAHYGEQRDVRSATYNSARVTHQFLPANDPDRLWADLRVADLRARESLTDGLSAYDTVAGAARAAGQPTIAMSASIHEAWTLHNHHQDPGAFDLLRDLVATPGEAARPYRLAARVLTARIARDRGDKAAIDNVLRAIASEPDPGQPLLVYSPPLPQPSAHPELATFNAPANRTNVQDDDPIGLQWVDIGFGIKADGTVDAPEVLRSSHAPRWAAPVIATIAARRYTPSAALAAGDDAPGHYRIERFTLTSGFSTPTKSLIRYRNLAPHFETIDLTDPDEVPKGKAG